MYCHGVKRDSASDDVCISKQCLSYISKSTQDLTFLVVQVWRLVFKRTLINMT